MNFNELKYGDIILFSSNQTLNHENFFGNIYKCLDAEYVKHLGNKYLSGSISEYNYSYIKTTQYPFNYFTSSEEYFTIIKAEDINKTMFFDLINKTDYMKQIELSSELISIITPKIAEQIRERIFLDIYTKLENGVSTKLISRGKFLIKRILKFTGQTTIHPDINIIHENTYKIKVTHVIKEPKPPKPPQTKFNRLTMLGSKKYVF
jgi:hypothetical protein